MASRVTGADRVIAGLRALGVEVVFGLPGVHNLRIWDALARSSVRLVGVRHEQTAAYAADGYARRTGRLGVAIVTTGPGAANTVTGVGEARASGSPVLVVATDVATSLRTPGVRRGVLHEVGDQPGLFAPLVKRASTVAGADRLAEDVVAAGRLATEAPSGPVYLGIPTDLLAAEAEGPVDDGLDPSPQRPPAPDPATLEAAREMIEGARRILIWAGGGAVASGAGPAVGSLAERIAAPVVTTFGARGLLPPDHPCGMPGPVHLPEVGRRWDEADLIIAVGTDLDGPMTQNWAMPVPRSLLAVNVDAADAAKSYRPDLVVTGDAREVMEALAGAVAPRDELDALRVQLAEIARAVDRRVHEDDEGAAALLDALAQVVPPDASFVVDMCVAGYWVGGFLPIRGPRRLAYPIGWGTLGFGFPASLGAAVAGAGRVVCVCGDGGFLYACGELATLAQERLPVTVVIVDDGGYGMLRFDQDREGFSRSGVDLTTPSFVALARAFGLRAEEVEGFGPPFAGLLGELTGAPGPNVLVVHASLTPPVTTSPRWYRRPPA